MDLTETPHGLVEVNKVLTKKLSQRNLIVWVLALIVAVLLIQPIVSLIPDAKFSNFKNILDPLLDDASGKYSQSTVSRDTGYKLVGSKYFVLRDEAVVYIPNEKFDEFLKDVDHTFAKNCASINQSTPSKSERTGFAAVIGNAIDADMNWPYLTFPIIKMNGKLIYIFVEQPG